MVGRRILASLLAGLSFFYIGKIQAHTESSYNDQSNEELLRQPREGRNLCKLQEPNDRWTDMSLGFGGFRRHSRGIFKVGMIFVDFPDAKEWNKPITLFNQLVPEAQQWYNISSYGRFQLQVQAEMSKFFRIPSRSTWYEWGRQTDNPKMNQYITDAMFATGSKSPFDGALDALYIVPSPAARAIFFSRTNTGRYTFTDGTVVKGGVVAFGQDIHLSYKVLNHENGHIIGLPDLYPLEDARLPTSYYVGGWSLMGSISAAAPDFFAWEKWKLGWIDDDQVSCVTARGDSQHIITPLEIPGGVKLISIKLNDTTALNMELRTNSGVDTDTCSQGLLFYTIDTTKSSGRGPLLVLDALSEKQRTCEASRGGRLSDAAINFSDGMGEMRLPQFGVRVRIIDIEGGNYRVKLQYSGGYLLDSVR